MEKILDRFLRYVSVDTQADPESETQPSAAKELDLLRMLRDEIQHQMHQAQTSSLRSSRITTVAILPFREFRASPSQQQISLK